MSYAAALEKAWADISQAGQMTHSIKILSDTYDIDIAQRTVMSASCNVPAKDYTVIILLHYLARKLAFKTLPQPTGDWIDFNQLDGGEAYYPTYRKRTIDRIIKKFGRKPEELAAAAARFPSKPGPLGDVSVIIYPFEDVGILIKMSKADEEFGPDANILYDAVMPKIFCTEDVVVLTEMVVHQL